MKLLLKAIIPGALALCACASANAQTAEELLTQGRDAFLDYNFSEVDASMALPLKRPNGETRNLQRNTTPTARNLQMPKTFSNA